MISIFMPIWKEQKVSPLIKEHRTIIIPFQKLVWQDIPCVEIAQVVGTILELPIIVSHPNCFLSTRGVALTTIILVMRRCAIPAAAFRNREWLGNLQSIYRCLSQFSSFFRFSTEHNSIGQHDEDGFQQENGLFWHNHHHGVPYGYWR